MLIFPPMITAIRKVIACNSFEGSKPTRIVGLGELYLIEADAPRPDEYLRLLTIKIDGSRYEVLRRFPVPDDGLADQTPSATVSLGPAKTGGDAVDADGVD